MSNFILASIIMLLLTACSAAPVSGEPVAIGEGSYKIVSVKELHTMLEDKDFLLVNVHIPFEGNISGTDLSIPYNEIEQNLSALPADKDSRIVLYCRSGRMSQIAAETLVSLGYTNVWDVRGGMVDWEAAGYPLDSTGP